MVHPNGRLEPEIDQSPIEEVFHPFRSTVRVSIQVRHQCRYGGRQTIGAGNQGVNLVGDRHRVAGPRRRSVS